MLKRILAGVVLALLLTGCDAEKPSEAEKPFEDGIAAAKRGDYATALRLLRPLAEQGHARAQFNLGVAYANGRGVPQDHAEAVKWWRLAAEVKWWRLAAEQGLANAQFNLGVAYHLGKGVPQDHAEAVKWWRLAAEQGEAQAQAHLGIMYDKGLGVPQDHAEAVKWFRLAAEQGYALAQLNLGALYANGQGVPQDSVQAHMWFYLAASQFSAPEAPYRDQAVKYRDIVASKMTPAQLTEAQRLAREWKPK
jgi:hypothetical protein